MPVSSLIRDSSLLSRQKHRMKQDLHKTHDFILIHAKAKRRLTSAPLGGVRWCSAGGLWNWKWSRGVCASTVREARRCFLTSEQLCGETWCKTVAISPVEPLGNIQQPAWGAQGLICDQTGDSAYASWHVYICQHFTLFASFRRWPGYTLNLSGAHEVKSCKCVFAAVETGP